MTLNGADAAHQTFGTPQDEVRDWSSKLYLGRSLSDMVRERYADAVFERLDIWNARKEYLVTHKIIRTVINGGGPRPPVVVQPQPPVVIRPQPPIVIRPQPPVVIRPQPPIVIQPQPSPQPPVIIDRGSINVIGGPNGFYLVNGSFGILPTRQTTPRPGKFTHMCRTSIYGEFQIDGKFPICGIYDIMPSQIYGKYDMMPCQIHGKYDAMPCHIYGKDDVMSSQIYGRYDVLASQIYD